MKYSKQRELILNYVHNNSSHPTAETIYENIQKEMPNLSLGTVYRNLNILSKNKKIRKIIALDKIIHFDNNKKPHSHFQCIKCREIFDIDPSDLKNSIESFEKNTNYKVILEELLITGICHKCQKKGEKK